MSRENIKELEEIIMDKVRELKDFRGEPEQEICVLETICAIPTKMDTEKLQKTE